MVHQKGVGVKGDPHNYAKSGKVIPAQAGTSIWLPQY